jgi:hypothetical protein
LAAIVSAAAIAPTLRRPETRATASSGADRSPSSRARVRVALVALLAVAIAAGGIAGHHGGLQLGFANNFASPPASTVGTGIG